MDQKRVNLLLKIASAFFAVLAVLLFVFGIIYDKGVLAKVLLFISSVFVLVLAAELAYLFVLSREVKPNFFLYNPVTNSNMSVQKLTFDDVNTKMNKYLSKFASSEGKLWTDKILENPNTSIEEKFKPIVAYKLLFDIAEHDSDAGWKCFVVASEATVDRMAEGVAQNGDSELAKALRHLKNSKPLNMKQTRDFLVGNKKYIKKKLFKYVVDNIDMF